MKSRKPADGVLGIFEHTDSMMEALRQARARQVEVRDVYTPVPNEEVAEFLSPRTSPVRFVTVTGALLGLVGGMALAIGTSLVWSIIVSGKPVTAVIPFLVMWVISRSARTAIAIGLACNSMIVGVLESTYWTGVWVSSAHLVVRSIRWGLCLSVTLVLGVFLGSWAYRCAAKPWGRFCLTGGTLVLLLVAVLLLFPPRAGTRDADSTDVILVVMDTARQDHLSLYGYSRPTTPGLEWLAEQAAVYEQAYSPAPWTPPSHASIFTGLLPAEHGTDGDYSTFDPPGESLPQILREAGYSTAAIVNNPTLAPGRGWDLGFDDYRDTWSKPGFSVANLVWRWRSKHEDWPWFGSAGRTVAAARRWWVATDDRPRFLFMNFIDPHSPYGESHRFRDVFLDDETRDAEDISNNSEDYDAGVVRAEGAELQRVVARYDGDILYLDSCLERLFRWLASRGQLDKTLVVVTADHGERLGERGLLGHQFGVDHVLLRVPLLVRLPAKVPPGRFSRLVHSHGIFMTILELLGLDHDREPVEPSLARQELQVVGAQMRNQGKMLDHLVSTYPDFDPTPFQGDWFAACDGRWKLVRTGQNELRLHDLAKDPDESENVLGEYPDQAVRLAPYLDALPPFNRGRDDREVSGEIIEMLRSLGYAQ